MDRSLHIVSFNIPYPDDYGGVIDVYHTLRTLHSLGVRIHLHCFEYGRSPAEMLNRYCASVHYYSRKTGHKGFSLELPYLVASRNAETLITRLLKDDHPILLEGLHCTSLCLDPRMAHRKIVLRAHNVEHRYYRQLAKSSRLPVPKLYYWWESRLLKSYECEIAGRLPVAAINEQDAGYFRETCGTVHCKVIPPFIPHETVLSQTGLGYYCLYHGNLSVPENDRSARFLLTRVFDELKIPLVIAGKNPSKSLERLAHRHKHTCLVANPGPKEMQDMISKAQIILIPAFNNTGTKLKLIESVFAGRHCVVNEAAVAGSGLEAACHIAGNQEAFKSLVMQLFHRPFEEEEILLRRKLTGEMYNNKKNGEYLIKGLW